MTCPNCGGPVKRKPGPGRPPVYCGRLCQVTAHGIRRQARRRIARREHLARVLATREGT